MVRRPPDLAVAKLPLNFQFSEPAFRHRVLTTPSFRPRLQGAAIRRYATFRQGLHGADSMNRRDTLLALLALGTVPNTANSQPQRKVWRIGMLQPGNLGIVEPQFIKTMEELGYVSGKDYVFEARYAGGDLSRLPALAAELVTQRVDLIIPTGTPAAIAARNATHEIPIVIAGVSDPVGTGLVSSLGRPGGNITGFARHAGMTDKHVDLLRQMVPGMVRVGVLFDPKSIFNAQRRTELESSCKQLGMRLINAPIGNPDEIARALARLKHERVQGLVVLEATIFDGAEKKIIDLATNQRLPTLLPNSEWVDAGGLISYFTVFVDLPRRTAIYVDKIFKGAKPSDLPIEQPNIFSLVVNRKTAKALGIVIPQSILIIADRVVE